MIGQRLAIEHPQLVKTLCSIMSSSGARALSSPQPAVSKQLRQAPRKERVARIDQAIQFRQLISGEAGATDLAELELRVRKSLDHGPSADAGTERQYMAILSDRNRFAELSRVKCPTTVIHGAVDPFVQKDHGEDTARRIAGARYIEVAGMGHEILRSNAKKIASVVMEAIALQV
jgi:pimeloyl-ACP methyl ester carboxylesterase